MKTKIITFIKTETVLSAAWILAFLSALIIHPDESYPGYIDWRSLGILWSLMVIMAGLKTNGLFSKIAEVLLGKTKKVWQLAMVLVLLCFLCSMLITNDVSLITFVPFAILILKSCGRENLLIPVITLQTIAANLGSMLTPVGNPQNLYLYGLSGMGVSEFIGTMLPYTLISGGLLLLCIFLLPGKAEKLDRKDPVSDESLQGQVQINPSPILTTKEIIYILLFLLALLVVARIAPWWLLAAAVMVIVFFMEKETLVNIDYALLFTFIGFFIFTGNMARIPAIATTLANLVEGREIACGVLLSQCISNVPAALLLSGFTENYRSLLLGVNFGGLGTLIASMASLISFKLLAHEYNEKKGRYLLVFTALNLAYLAILLIAAAFLN